MIPDALIPEFKRTLFAGGYNLLLGSGVSLDSTNEQNRLLRGADDLRKSLCAITCVPESTSLSRVSALLDDDQVKNELVIPYKGCVPGPSLKPLPNYLWRRVFTFNIDDVFEHLYDSIDAKQLLAPLNYDSPFEPTPDRRELQLVHLHGWVEREQTRFVFSKNDYAKVMRDLNPWMHLLSEIISTESFIVAGTSLDESDLEFYLSSRSDATPRRSRGPSLLIEPSPNQATKMDCLRHGLTLIQGTFGEFLKWLNETFPAPPSITELIVPDITKLFQPVLTPANLLRFYTDFQPVPASEESLSGQLSPFLYGRQPDWNDISQHIDIERSVNATITKAIEKAFDDKSRPALILLTDDPGTGKTTTIKRVSHSAVVSGRATLTVNTVGRIDAINAISCLTVATVPILLLVDGLADHVEQIVEILASDKIRVRVVVLASERSYRMNFVNLALGSIRSTQRSSLSFSLSESRQLLERYRNYGLIADSQALRNPESLARKIQADPVAIAICRILNDYRPLENIVDSLWDASDDEDRLPYLCTALAHYCYSQGIRYSILQALMGPTFPISKLYSSDRPLRLTDNPMFEDFIIPMQSIIAERILQRAVVRTPELLLKAFSKMGSTLAPHVNRTAVMRRTAEARLAGRLFDADKVVRPLLCVDAEKFYISVFNEWNWNSRYWEQRALLIADSDIVSSLRYARHAVAVELHPHTLTTLGKILLKRMDADSRGKVEYFGEAFDKLTEAIESEARNYRVSIHPYVTLFGGVIRYLECGGVLVDEKRSKLSIHLARSNQAFPRDSVLQAQIQHLTTQLS